MGTSRPIWGLLVVVAVLAAAAIAPATASAATATTGGVTDLTSGSAVLNGTASPSQPNSFYYFDYGTTTAYGKSTPHVSLTGVPNEAVSAPITGLLPGTTYHCRLVVGSTYMPNQQNTNGRDVVFTTPTEAPATTGQASSIGTTSALLNGVANTAGPNSSWFFQYGRTAGYGQTTATHPVGTGVTLLATKVAGLSPHTTYHFRLVVLQGAVAPSYGRDASFTTARPNGHATLTSHRLKVRHGFAAIAFKCSGSHGALCKAQISLKARGKVGKHVRTLSCGNGRLSTSASHRQTVHAKLGRCGPPLRKARRGRLHATLRVVFSTNQRTIQTGVTLIKP
jgi:hypothetical protein